MAATELTVGGISAVHALYLQRGGLRFSDRRRHPALRPGDRLGELLHAQRIHGLFATLDLQHIINPAYNRDRGPVWVGALRLHVEWGKK